MIERIKEAAADFNIERRCVRLGIGRGRGGGEGMND